MADTRQLRKGFAVQMPAHGLVIVSAYLLNALLARVLSVEDFGTYGVATTLLTWLEYTLVIGIPVTVAKFVAEGDSRDRAIFRLGLRDQAVLVAVSFVVLVGASGLLATLLHDPQLTDCFRIVFLDVPIFGIFYLYAERCRGLKLFRTQAILVVTLSVCRVGFTAALAAMDFGVRGVLFAYPLSSVVALIVALLLSPKPRGSETFDRKAFRRVGIPMTAFLLSVNFLMNIDLWCLKSLSGDEVAIGFYRSAQVMARTPHFFFGAFMITAFPFLSGALARREFDAAGAYFRDAFRILLVLLIFLSVVIWGAAEGLLDFVFSEPYRDGAAYLRVLILGYALLTLVKLFLTVTVAEGRSLAAFMAGLGMSALETLLCWLLIGWIGPVGAAWGMASAAGAGLVAVAWAVSRQLGPPLSMKSAIRIGAAGAVLILLAGAYNPGKLMLIPYGLVLGGIYLGILIYSRELRLKELISFVRPH